MGRFRAVLVWGLCAGWAVMAQAGVAEKGSGTFCRNGPLGALHKMYPTPFPRVTAEIEVYPQVTLHDVSPRLVAANLSPQARDKELLGAPATLDRVKAMGVKAVRFPSGCLADKYDWRNPPKGQITVDEFLDFCESIGAEACYTINLQGGTDGLEGAPPADTVIEERIRYRHTAANPCGDTDYCYGTLSDAIALFHKYTIERALAGKLPLTRFVLGHENWSRAGSDWPADVYGATCEAYIRALLNTYVDFNAEQLKLGDLATSFVMVGYPSLGGGGDAGRAGDRAANETWTAEVNRLAELGLIDAVQEHFCADGDVAGGPPGRTARDFLSIASVRAGARGEESGGGVDSPLKYSAPMELSKWDVKCGSKASGGAAAAKPADRLERRIESVEVVCASMRLPGARVYYQLFGDGPDGLISAGGGEQPNAAALELLAGRVGEQLVRTDVETARFEDTAPAEGGAGSAEEAGSSAVSISTVPQGEWLERPAQRPAATEARRFSTGNGTGKENIPVLSATATRHGNDVYVVLVNRSTDRPVHACIRLRACTVKPEGEVRTSAGDGSGAPSGGIRSAPLAVANPLLRTVAPLSAEVIRVELGEVNETPLVLSAKRIEQSVRVGVDPEDDRLTLSTTGAEPVRFSVYADADWLTVAPPAGLLSGERPQELAVSYSTERLAPGHYTANFEILSPDAYNSPKQVRVDLTVRPVRPDFDGDGDVDEDDFEKFKACLMAPPAVQASPACAYARLAGTDHVDINDYYIFESCFSGPDRRPGERCPE